MKWSSKFRGSCIKRKKTPCLKIHRLFFNCVHGHVRWLVCLHTYTHRQTVAQSAEAVENTNCFSIGGKTPPNERLGYETKQSDGEVPIMRNLWRMQSTPSLPFHLGPLWLGMVASNRVLFLSQTEPNCVIFLNWIVWNRIVLTFNLI